MLNERLKECVNDWGAEGGEVIWASQRDSALQISVANKDQIELLMTRKRAAVLKMPTNRFSSHRHDHRCVTSLHFLSDDSLCNTPPLAVSVYCGWLAIWRGI